MAFAAKKAVVEIQPIKMRRIIIDIVGTTPFIMHRFNAKAWRELLYPSQRKNRNERATSLKHDPVEEYRGSFYLNRDPKTPTLFHLPDGMVHGCLSSSALDVDGPAKAQIERWTNVVSENINLYGLPVLGMDMVRSSDAARTPDVRTRPFFPQWACTVEIEYKVNPLTDEQIMNLLASAGQIVGMGDGRPQKARRYGKFRICGPDDHEFLEITKTMGRKPQEKRYYDPIERDEDTAELLSWFNAEVARRRQERAPQGQAQERKRRSGNPNGSRKGPANGRLPAIAPDLQ
jgi:hypothetical protein